MNALITRSFNRSRSLCGASSRAWANPSSCARPSSPSCIHQHALSAAINRPFSTPAAAEETPRKPSALERANLPVITPGHAIGILQLHAAGGRQLLRTSDVHKLFHSSRPGKKKDAKVITTALREFKRCNKYILTKEGGHMALLGIMRSMTPNYKVVYGLPKIEAATYALQQINEETGLYYATKTFMVNKIMGEMKDGLNEMVERGISVKVDLSEDGADETESEEIDEAMEGPDKYATKDAALLKSALSVTESIVKLLTKRRSLPEQKMKKRAKRAYLKHLKTSDGPDASTMKLATEISLLMADSAYVENNILGPYREAWWTKGKVDESALSLVEEAKKKEDAEKAALEAAAAEAAAAEAEEKDSEESSDAEDEGSSDAAPEEGEVKDEETK